MLSSAFGSSIYPVSSGTIVFLLFRNDSFPSFCLKHNLKQLKAFKIIRLIANLNPRIVETIKLLKRNTGIIATQIIVTKTPKTANVSSFQSAEYSNPGADVSDVNFWIILTQIFRLFSLVINFLKKWISVTNYPNFKQI